MKYQAILWDIDGTLLDFAYSQRHSISKCLKEIGIDPTEEIISWYAANNDRFWKLLEEGKITKERLKVGRFETLFEHLNITDVDPLEFCNAYEDNLGKIFQCMEGAMDTIANLHGKVKQYVVTNGIAKPQMTKLRLSHIADYMDDIFISELVGAPKPQKAFFERVFEQAPEIEPKEFLIVGDSLTSDMRGGMRAGIGTCWFNPGNQVNDTEVICDYEIARLKDVLRIIMQ